MGLFNLFKKPPAIQDELFGKLRFVDFKDPLQNYFEGKVFFNPSQAEIVVLIHSDLEGPGAEQRAFYKEVENNFDRYLEKIKPLIEDEFRNWKEAFEIRDFNKEFTMDCITIPRIDVRPYKWEMVFTTVHDRNHYVTIDFVDKEPKGILIDG
jgi:hypothetical protein